MIEGKPEIWNCATEEYGTYCQFPFFYDGEMHHECINLNNTAPEEVHCASSTFKDRTAKNILKCLPDSCVIGKLQLFQQLFNKSHALIEYAL